ncbi:MULTISPECIES: hypothetical protein [Prosthecochloris]|nr:MULTISPECIES: hypothetical protein [Prosthecochloris]
MKERGHERGWMLVLSEMFLRFAQHLRERRGRHVALDVALDVVF